MSADDVRAERARAGCAGRASADQPGLDVRDADERGREPPAMPPGDAPAGLADGTADVAAADADASGSAETADSGASIGFDPAVDAPVPPPPFRPDGPGTVLGRYRLLEQIGEGGFGIVFMAEQQHPVRRRVAVKVIKAGMDTRQVIARFEAERQALALMDHPNIARVLDAGATEGGRPYFVMELVRGVPITQFCDQNHLAPRQRLELFVQVCHAVQHAHQKGIIHRDLKPSNILVTLNDGVPLPKVIDFGIAKATGQQLTERTLFTNYAQMIGTPLYMSPEQAEMSALDVDTRSDIYSLGVLLYELLTGTTPFDKERLSKAAFDEVRRIIREEDPPRPSTRISTMGQAVGAVSAHRRTDPKRLGRIIRGELDWIVMKALDKDRSRRYEAVSGLAKDLQRYLADEPVTACPPSAAYRAKKFVRRHKAGAAAAAAVLATLAAGLGTSAWLYARERDARRDAEAAVGREREARREAEAATAREADARRRAEQATVRETHLRLRFQAETIIDDARFLARNREPAGAERRLAALPALLAQLDPRGAAAVYARLGALRASQGRWAEAAAAYAGAIEREPDDIEHYHWCVPALIAGGDLDGYRRLREKMLARFSATSDPRTAERVVKDCLVLPWPEADARTLDALADLAIEADPRHWAMGYFQFARGLAHYRHGRFEPAMQLMQVVIRRGEDRNRVVQAYMVLAMAAHGLGRTDEARAAREAGRSLARTYLPARGQRWLEYSGWNDLTIAWALMDEATSLVGTGPTHGADERDRR